MSVVLDKKKILLPGHLSEHSTLGDVLNWAQLSIAEGRVLVAVSLNGKLLENDVLSSARREQIGTRQLVLTSGDRKELSLTLLGKLAALIEWLTPQHKNVADMLERGETQRGLERLAGLLSAWQQIQTAYGSLAKMLELSLVELPVQEVTGEVVLNEFCRQLGEIESALQKQDFVLLADILQYEMEGAVTNWRVLLEATLGVVEPVGAL